jgi:hypothetical protein
VQGFLGIDEKEDEETQWERKTEKKRNPIKERKEKKRAL